MGFADKYLEKHCSYSIQVKETPANDLNISIVIPCYNEPEVLQTLQALYLCDRPTCSAEVLLVINSSEVAPDHALLQNKETEKEVNLWRENHSSDQLRFHVLHIKDLPKKYAGPGLARKIGMDEAIARFNAVDNPDGVIVSLDADTTCDTNYLVEIEKQFQKHPKTNGCNIYFEHPIEGDKYPQEIYNAIIQYELYLRYYLQALRFSGYPYATHTVGSCFAVKASVYAKQGGMNRKQAGEDFYFLQKIVPLGNFYEINTTRVMPSPRPSDRVAFGTGPVIQELIDNDKKEIQTYDFRAFIDLKQLFDRLEDLFKIEKQTYDNFVEPLPLSVKEYLKQISFFKALEEINSNSSNLKSFKNRFFKYFNALRILQYLNVTHEKYYKEIPVVKAAVDLLSRKKDVVELDARKVLMEYRLLEKD